MQGSRDGFIEKTFSPGNLQSPGRSLRYDTEKLFALANELICDRHDFIIAKWIDVIHLVRHISYRLERLNRSTTYQLVASVMNRSVKILKQSEHLDYKCPTRNNQYSIGCAQDAIILTCFLKWHFQYFKFKINCANSKRSCKKATPDNITQKRYISLGLTLILTSLTT